MQQQQQAVRSQASRRPNVLILLLLALLVAAALTVYSFRDTIFAYWDAPPVDTPVEEPPVDTPVAPVEEPPGSDPVDAEPPAAEEPPTVEEPPAVEKPPAAENPAADPPAAVRQLANGDDLLALVTKETSLGKYEPTDLVTIPAEMGLYDTRYQLRASLPTAARHVKRPAMPALTSMSLLHTAAMPRKSVCLIIMLLNTVKKQQTSLVPVPDSQSINWAQPLILLFPAMCWLLPLAAPRLAAGWRKTPTATVSS